MALTYPVSGGGDFKGCPAGSHIAVCDIVADLGIQPGSDLYPKPKPQVYIRFEIPAERIEWEKDGKKHEGPAIIGRIFTASMHEKAALRIALESWRGRKFTDEEAAHFDISTILGNACMLNAVESDKGRVKLQGLSPLPKGVQAPGAEIPLIYYAKENMSDFEKLQPWVQEKIEKQIVYQPKSATMPELGDEAAEITDDDIPF
jgi:hypothetical protein